MPPTRKPRKRQRRKGKEIRKTNFNFLVEFDVQRTMGRGGKVEAILNTQAPRGTSTRFYDKAVGTTKRVRGAEYIGKIVRKRETSGGNGRGRVVETTYWYVDRRGEEERRKKKGTVKDRGKK